MGSPAPHRCVERREDLGVLEIGVVISPVPLVSAWAHDGSRGILVCVRVSAQSHGDERAVPSLLLSPPQNTPHPIFPLAETCQRPVWWDPRLQMAPVRGSYKKNEEVTLSCDSGFQPSFTHVKCAGGAQTLNYSGSLNRDVWLGRKSSDAWIHIEGNIVCIGKQGVRRCLLGSFVVKSCPVHPPLRFHHQHCGQGCTSDA